MVQFTIALAGLTVSVETLYPETAAFCAGYRCSSEPDFFVCTGKKEIEQERVAVVRESAYEGLPEPHYTDAELEITAVYRQIASHLPSYGAWVFHGSAVVVDGKAYLFTAKSGTGKSTHTRLWRQLWGSQAVMINDDKPILRIDDTGAVRVHGTPWDGKHHLSTNTSAHLYGLAILERSVQNKIVRIGQSEAWPMLLQQSYRPTDVAAMQETMALLNVLSASVPLYRLYCNQTIDAARVAYETMRTSESFIKDSHI